MSEFQMKIQKFIIEMQQYKNNPKKGTRWIDLYDEYLDQLQDILETSNINEECAINDFKQMLLSQYDNFSAYVYSNTSDTKSIKHNEIIRPKMSRVSHKKVRCQSCGSDITIGITLEGYTCSVCGYSGELNGISTQKTTVSDLSKHVIKLIDTLSGVQAPTKAIVNILPHVITWVTNKHFIYEWLQSCDGVDKWIADYNKKNPDDRVEAHEYFAANNMIVERIPENSMSYETFRLYSSELYNMFQTYKKIADKSNTSMIRLDSADIEDIITAYIDEFGDDLPDQNYIYELDGERYDIGYFINFLSLIYDDESYPIKKVVERLFNKKILQPGLMCNFNEIGGSTNIKLPEKYHYGQEFAYFMHEIFHVKYPVLTQNDKQHMINLIITFNNYYKNENKTLSNKGSNSPIFPCSLEQVLGLPYFGKYRESIMKLMPVKSDNTVASISAAFITFKLFNRELIKPYLTITDELPPLQSTSSTTTTTIKKKQSVSNAELDDDNEII
jgi:transposase-like protein